MQELVTINGTDIFTDSKVIADGTGNQHNSVTRIIRNYKKDFLEFGKLEFMDLKSKNPAGGRPEKIYLLNEEQATLLMTYLGNTEIVRKFKVELVHQFYEMRRFILEKQTSAWIETRQQGKLTRKSETDVIKQLVEYAKEQGSEHSDKLYMTYSKLANKMAGVSDRENATVIQLNNLSLIEHIILNCIQSGMMMDKHYKEIYQDCKHRLIEFKEVAYLESA